MALHHRIARNDAAAGCLSRSFRFRPFISTHIFAPFKCLLICVLRETVDRVPAKIGPLKLKNKQLSSRAGVRLIPVLCKQPMASRTPINPNMPKAKKGKKPAGLCGIFMIRRQTTTSQHWPPRKISKHVIPLNRKKRPSSHHHLVTSHNPAGIGTEHSISRVDPRPGTTSTENGLLPDDVSG